jgi:hypothetical protein
MYLCIGMVYRVDRIGLSSCVDRVCWTCIVLVPVLCLPVSTVTCTVVVAVAIIPTHCWCACVLVWVYLMYCVKETVGLGVPYCTGT